MGKVYLFLLWRIYQADGHPPVGCLDGTAASASNGGLNSRGWRVTKGRQLSPTEGFIRALLLAILPAEQVQLDGEA